MAGGAADVLAKPFDLDELLAVLARFVPLPSGLAVAAAGTA